MIMYLHYYNYNYNNYYFNYQCALLIENVAELQCTKRLYHETEQSVYLLISTNLMH